MIYIPISVYKSIYFASSLPKLNIVFLKFCNFDRSKTLYGLLL